MSGPAPCPDPQRLRQLLAETLPSDEQADLSAHLQQCGRCQELLEGLAAGKDSWEEASDLLACAPPVRAVEPALQRVLARLTEQSPAGPPPPANDVSDLPFLGPPSRAGSLGRLAENEILGVVGRGGMGVVLKAFDDVLHRVVAIKVIAPSLASSPEARKRFIREAQAAAAVTHDHVVTIHAVHDRPVPFLVMQFVPGVSLDDKLEQSGPLDIKEILRIGMQTAAGLAAAHAQGLVHRDVKPANILLENGIQRVKITDFGLARMIHDETALTRSGTVAGTPSYMSPEQARGDPFDHRSDLFSLGSVLYALCTGRPPFTGSTGLAVLRRVCDEPAPPIRAINPAIPDELVAVVEKLHSKDPADRYDSAAEVAEILAAQLARLQEGLGGRTPVTLSPVLYAAKRPAGRRRALPWLLAALAGAVVGGVLYFGPGKGEGEPEQRHDTPSGPPPAPAPGPAASRPNPVVCTGHTAAINEVAFSSDKVTVASAGDDRSVRLWDARTGALRHVLPGHEAPIWGLAFSPDGRTLASAGEGGEVRLWEAATGRPLDVLKGDGAALLCVAFAPDGKTLAVGVRDRSIRLWTLATRTARRQTDEESAGQIRRLAFAPDGKTLVSAGHQLTFWDAHTLERRRSVGFTNATGLAFTRDGKHLVVGSWKAGTVSVLNPDDGRPIALWQGDLGDLENLAVSPDGRLVVAAGANGVASAWDIESQRVRARWPAHPGGVRGVAFSPDGLTLATVGGGEPQVKVWDLARVLGGAAPPQPDPLVVVPVLKALQGHGGAVVGIAFSPDGGTLASASHDRTVRLWDARTGALRHRLDGPQQPVEAVTFSPDGLTLASGGGGEGLGEVLLWDVKTGRAGPALPAASAKVWDVAFAPDAKGAGPGRLAAACWDRKVRIYDQAERKEVLALTVKQDTTLVRRVAFSRDGQTLLAAGDVVSFYASHTGEELRKAVPHRDTTDLKVSPRGGLLAVSGWKSGEVTLLQVATGKPAGLPWQAHRDYLNGLAFSPDGRFLATAGGEGCVKIWDVATKRQRSFLFGHRGRVYGVAFSPDGSTLATSGEQDHTVLLWDVSALHIKRAP